MSFICDRSASEYVQAAMLHSEATLVFIKKAEELLKSHPYEITTGCSKLGILIKKRANAVLREIHILSAYTRLKPYPEYLLVGECKTEHTTGFSIAKSLARRFNGFIILVFTQSSYYIMTLRKDVPLFPKFNGKNQSSILKKVREYIRLHIKEYLSEDILLEDGEFLWEEYYETQFLEQRLNTRLFHRFIPKYVMEKANMKVEKNFYEKVTNKNKNNQTLDNYFEDN